ncbi:MMPL family transporter [uncultured Acinetobacter sp.]|uniref:MMPL family transporter n=1 Tax=uncultured Acinetobacter sp. TaxID=165433 RepID=UPI003748158D
MNKHFSSWQNKLSALWLIILIVIGLVMGVAWLKKDIHIQTNIFALLPELSQDADLVKTQQYVSEQLNSRVFLVIDAKNVAQLQQATMYLQQAVAQSTLFEPLQPEVNTEQLGQTLYQHRAGLISPEDQQLLDDHDYQSLTEKSLMQLFTPGLPVNAESLKHDPLMLFSRYVLASSQHLQSSQVELENGFATIHDANKISRLFTLKLKQSPYNIDYQEQTTAWIEQSKQQLHAMQVTSHWTGTLLFSNYGTQSAQKEISTIGLGSTLGLILLVWFGFRSFRPLFTEFIAVSTGSLVAFAATHWVFGEIHLMTLVFGASLIGVCVDFSFYFMAMQSQHRSITGFEVLKPLLPSLFMGLMTTVVAYVFLSFTPFPGFKQIAVFSIVGLVSAWITSILLLPRLPALNAEPAIRHLKWIGTFRVWFQSKRLLSYVSVICILVVGLSSLLFLKSNDDIRNLQSMDRGLKQEDQYVRERFMGEQGRDYFVVRGDTPAQMQRNEQVLIQYLQNLQQQGKLTSFQALGQWIPTQDQQQQNIQRLKAIPAQVLQQYAQNIGLTSSDVMAWQQQLDHLPLLTLQDFKQHPLAFLQVNPNERLVMLNGVKDNTDLLAIQNKQVMLQQPIHDLSMLFKQHRIQAQSLFMYALLALAVGLGLIYGWRSVFPLVLPVSLALLTTFAIQVWLGIEINLFSIMGTFLIVGIGVDYAIFYRHGHDHPQVVGMALFLCMMSTLLGFGLLSLSHTYAIHCFGLTVLFGVIFSFIYATLLTRADEQHVVISHYQSKN